MSYKLEYNKRGFVVLGAFIVLGAILALIDFGSTGLRILGYLIVFMGFLSLLIISSTLNSLYIAARILENQAKEEMEKEKEEHLTNREKDNEDITDYKTSKQ